MMNSPVSVPVLGIVLYALFYSNISVNAASGMDMSDFYRMQINDSCIAAISVLCGDTLTGSTTGATPDPAIGVCGTSLTTAGGLWFTYSGDGYPVTASLCNSTFDTKLGIFSGSCDNLLCIWGIDDFCQLQSQLTFNALTGTTYYIYVTGFAANTGDFSLTIACSIAGCTDQNAYNYMPNATMDDGSCFYIPDNDSCQYAIEMYCADTLSGSLRGATAFDAPLNDCDTALGIESGGWFRLTGTGDSMCLSACGSNFETKMTLFESIGSQCDSLRCLDIADDTCSPVTTLSFLSDSGTEYYIYLSGADTAVYDYTISVICLPVLCSVSPVVSVQNITSSSLTLNWNPIAGAEAYRLTGNRIGFPLINPITLGNLTTFTLVGLTSGACYNWQVAAVCDQSANIQSPYSNRDTTCLQGICTAPDSIFVDGLLPTMVTLHWEVVSGAAAYRIFGRVQGSSQIVTINISSGIQDSLLVTGLPPGESYDWAMQTVCNGPVFSAISMIDSFTLPTN